MPIFLPRLDLMISYSCNFACKGCISISDRARSGIEPKPVIDQWIRKWQPVVAPAVITLFGGEPCLHPNLQDIAQSVREAWPDSVIRLITNGLLLDNFAVQRWFDLVPFEIQISVHRKDQEPKINGIIKKILTAREPWKTSLQGGPDSHRQITWAHADGLKVFKSIFAEFIRPYKAQGQQILPWHSDPKDAHRICGAPNTPVLYKGLLYKCPAVANAIDLSGVSWYGYSGFDVDSDLNYFATHVGQPESCCSQCPDSTQADIINHLDRNNVKIKNLD